MIRKATSHLPNVEVEASDELLAHYARRKGACVVVKGLRAVSDFESEFTMSLINKKLNPELDTMFLTAPVGGGCGEPAECGQLRGDHILYGGQRREGAGTVRCGSFRVPAGPCD